MVSTGPLKSIFLFVCFRHHFGRIAPIIMRSLNTIKKSVYVSINTPVHAGPRTMTRSKISSQARKSI